MINNYRYIIRSIAGVTAHVTSPVYMGVTRASIDKIHISQTLIVHDYLKSCNKQLKVNKLASIPLTMLMN